MSNTFQNIIFNAIGTGVICRQPFSGIKLLQLIGNDQVRQNCDEYVFDYPNKDTADTLMSLMEDLKLKKELEALVKDAVEQQIVALNEKEKAGIPYVFLKDITSMESRTGNIDSINMTRMKRSVAPSKKPRLSEFSDVYIPWEVFLGNEKIKRRAVSHHKLRKFYRSPDLHLDLERHMGVVTAIYFISGGLTFSVDTKAVSNAGVDYRVIKDHVAEGWHYSVEKGAVIVKEINPAEWIVAIEYRNLAMDKKDAEVGRRQLILIDPSVSKKTLPLTLET